jgi:hypothetical protein
LQQAYSSEPLSCSPVLTCCHQIKGGDEHILGLSLQTLQSHMAAYRSARNISLRLLVYIHFIVIVLKRKEMKLKG